MNRMATFCQSSMSIAADMTRQSTPPSSTHSLQQHLDLETHSFKGPLSKYMMMREDPIKPQTCFSLVEELSLDRNTVNSVPLSSIPRFSTFQEI